MTIFLVLAPFGAFAMLLTLTPVAVALFVAAALALAVIGYDVFRGNSVKTLMASSLILFGALGCYDLFSHGGWSTVTVRLAVDGGVLAIALGSIALRKPFTLQYARENADAETREQPHLVRVSYIVAWAWTAAFLLMLAADVVTIYRPGLPLWAGVGIAFVARNAAVFFTKWYPSWHRARLAQDTTAA
jgi:hypothetical protein